MWLIIRKLNGAIVGTNYHYKPTANEDFFEIKEWHGPEPPIHDPNPVDEGEPIYSYDPTLNDPTYSAFLERRVDFDELANRAIAEIEWLNDTIPQIDTMTAAQVRGVVKRLAQENLRQIKAWRYIFNRLV